MDGRPVHVDNDCLWLLMLQIMSALSVFFIVVSILTFCLKTHPNMRVPVIHNSTVFVHWSPSSSAVQVPLIRRSNQTYHVAARPLAWRLDKRKTQPHEAFFLIECICNAWFTFELAIRSVLLYSSYLRRRLANEGIVMLVTLSRSVCVRRAAYRLHAALVSAAKVMRCIQYSLVITAIKEHELPQAWTNVDVDLVPEKRHKSVCQ